MSDEQHSQPTPPPLPGAVFVRPGIDDRPDYEKVLTPAEKEALARLAIRDRRRAPEASSVQAEAQASQLAAAGSPASAAASVDAAVPDLTSAFLDMRDPMVAADGEKPTAAQVARFKWGFALAAVLATMPWAALTMVALPVAAGRVTGLNPAFDDAALGQAAGQSVAVPLGVIVALGAIVSLIASPFVSAFSDRTRVGLGRRTPWMVVGGVLSALLTLILGAVDGIVALGFFWMLLNISYAMLTVPLVAAFSERVPDKFRVSLVRWRGIGQLLGQLLGAWLGAAGIIADGWGGYLPFVLSALVLALSGIVVALVWPREPSSESLPRERLRGEALWGQLRPPRNAPRFIRMFWVRLLMMAGVGLTGVFLWLIVRYYNEDAASRQAGASAPMTLAAGVGIGALALATAIGAAVAARLAGPINERYDDARRPAAAACALYVVALALPLALPNLIGLCLFALLAGFAFGLYDALSQTLVMESLPDPRRAGRDLAAFNVSNTLGLIVAAVAGACLVSAFGLAVLFPAAVVCVAGAGALVISLAR
ncbi:MFS transporter [Bifidobacterium eulemuris]|uniref:MFS transporter n=1 Tax=Bifidobacterium eulemuris TaxID=1765219 RepID=A0A261GER4_9BIFI|nr:MFS transporter [Bifidobacterium eulemuris]OZG69693.1 transport protein [Bifidobacterium eulemuris]QOL32203.1 MFS transporter [Bifidobacterium eulemuris]